MTRKCLLFMEEFPLQKKAEPFVEEAVMATMVADVALIADLTIVLLSKKS